MTDRLPEVVMLPVSRRELEFLNRAVLLGSAFIQIHEGHLSDEDIATRVTMVLAGWRKMYDPADMKALFEKLHQLTP